MALISSVDSRLVFVNARRRLKKLAQKYKRTIDWQTTRLSQSFLRSEVRLDATNTIYTFPILVNEGSTVNTEKRLNLQDTFFVSHFGVFFRVNSGAVYGTELDSVMFTNPSARINGSGGTLNLDGLVRLWSKGAFKLTVDNRVICPQWDALRHLYIPQTQVPVTSGIPTEYNYQDQFDGGQDGFYPVEPNWMLSGSKNNLFQLQLDENIPAASLPTISSVVVIFRGVLAQNSTSIY